MSINFIDDLFTESSPFSIPRIEMENYTLIIDDDGRITREVVTSVPQFMQNDFMALVSQANSAPQPVRVRCEKKIRCGIDNKEQVAFIDFINNSYRNKHNIKDDNTNEYSL